MTGPNQDEAGLVTETDPLGQSLRVAADHRRSRRTRWRSVISRSPTVTWWSVTSGGSRPVCRTPPLSGGMQQWAQIARERQKTIFFITHSVEEAVFLGDRVLVMSPRPGRVVLDEMVEISKKYGRLLPGKELRSTPEFVDLRDRIADTIYTGQAPA